MWGTKHSSSKHTSCTGTYIRRIECLGCDDQSRADFVLQKPPTRCRQIKSLWALFTSSQQVRPLQCPCACQLKLIPLLGAIAGVSEVSHLSSKVTMSCETKSRNFIDLGYVGFTPFFSPTDRILTCRLQVPIGCRQNQNVSFESLPRCTRPLLTGSQTITSWYSNWCGCIYWHGGLLPKDCQNRRACYTDSKLHILLTRV